MAPGSPNGSQIQSATANHRYPRNINNRIALTSTNSTASGSVTDDDATVAFTQQVHLAWQKCTK